MNKWQSEAHTDPSFLTIAASRSRFLRYGRVVRAGSFIRILRNDMLPNARPTALH